MKKKFYITTAIDYINDVIHVGHAYQKVAADIIARYHRLLGEDVFLLMGTDEHGGKAEEAAKEKKLTPKKFADQISLQDKKELASLNVFPDRFIRTTDSDHIKTVARFWQKVFQNGDIYLADFEGQYCHGCEEFKTDSELVDGRCPYHPKLELEKVKEKNYFFRWSRYQSFLENYIKSHPSFIKPESRRKEMLAFLERGLKDISISRQNISWGIPVPGDPQQTIYVWFDALINYLTGAPKGFWPADLHLLGKDNTRWHALLWPAMLKSAGYPLPKTIYAHGFLSFGGEKISKSRGNIIRPHELSQEFTADGARYLLIAGKSMAEDSDISWLKMKQTYNSDLANGLGNLVSRLRRLCQLADLLGGEKELAFSQAVSDDYRQAMENFQLAEALRIIWLDISRIDRFLNQEKPWQKKGEQQKEILHRAVKETLRVAVLLAPFMPETSKKIRESFQGLIVAGAPLFFKKKNE